MPILTRIALAFTLLFAMLIQAYGQNSYERSLQRGPFAAHQAPKAPEWDISEWVKGPETSLEKLKGKVVIIDFFQLWCPGCNKFSIPLMATWEKEFAKEIKEGKLALISIHTVFEGHTYQTVKRLKSYIIEKKIGHPVAVDHHVKGNHLPETMQRYNTNGTPEMSFIDKKGRIRFQKFGYFDPDWATKYIRELLEEKDSVEKNKKVLY